MTARAVTRRFAAILLTLAGLAALPAAAEDNPVLLELYTSQGCSSCPPADEILHRLAEREDVIALALHVDYWDYIGWKDSFASPRFTARQKRYARAMGERSVYTPQLVVDGAMHVVGNRPMDVAEAIRKQAARDHGVDLDISRDGDVLTIAASRDGAPFAKPVVVQMVRYRPSATVAIKRGENAGRTLHYTNIVTDWSVLGEWSGKSDLSQTVPVGGNAPVVIVIQQPGHGEVLAAARLR